MPNSISICSLMKSTNVPYKSNPKRARTGTPDLEMVFKNVDGPKRLLQFADELFCAFIA